MRKTGVKFRDEIFECGMVPWFQPYIYYTFTLIQSKMLGITCQTGPLGDYIPKINGKMAIQVHAFKICKFDYCGKLMKCFPGINSHSIEVELTTNTGVPCT